MKRKKYMTVTEAVQYLLQNTVKGVTYNSETSEMTITYNREDGIATETFTVGGGDTSELEQAIENLEQNLGTVEQNLGNVEDDVADLKSNKQDKLKAGSGITINPETNEISSDGATYTAGTNINIDSDNKISCTVDTSDFVKKKVYGSAQVSTIDRVTTTSIAGITLESKFTMYSNIGSFVKYLQEAGADPGATLLIDSSVNNPRDEDANDRARIKAKSKSFLMNLNNSKYSKTITADNSPKMTESIMLDSNNSYSKTLNPTTNSYSETFKYSPANNVEIKVTKEYFKYIGDDDGVVLSADVTVLGGIYDVTTTTIKYNNDTVEITKYNNIMGTNFDEYRCIKNKPENIKSVVKKSALGLQTIIYIYDTSTTPETLTSTEIYAMTKQP